MNREFELGVTNSHLADIFTPPSSLLLQHTNHLSVKLEMRQSEELH